MTKDKFFIAFVLLVLLMLVFRDSPVFTTVMKGLMGGDPTLAQR